MKIFPVGAEFHANERTDTQRDMTELILAL